MNSSDACLAAAESENLTDVVINLDRQQAVSVYLDLDGNFLLQILCCG